MKRLHPKQLLTFALMLVFSAAIQAAGTLADLVRAEQHQAAVEMIQAGANVNMRSGDGSTALLWAVYHLDEALVDMLLSREADPDLMNSYGASPLAEAVKAANLQLTEKLLDAGADVNISNEDGQTVLMLASRTGEVDIAELLIRHGADVNAREQWRDQTALMWAVANRHAGVAELLIEHGAEVEIRARTFDWGSQITSEPRAQYRPTGGLTPLLYAARSGCISCIGEILDAGADIDRPSPDGVTPLMTAIDNLRFDAAAYLLERDANPHVWDWWGRTALYIATDMNSFPAGPGTGASLDEKEELRGIHIMHMLLEAGVNPNPQLNMHRPGRGSNSGRFTDDMLTTGATPLIRAAYSHDLEAIRLLLEYGAEVDRTNVFGITPFMVAAGFGHDRGELIRGKYSEGTEEKVIPVLEVLLEAGADINKRIEDTTSHNARIARLSSMTDRQGQTALTAAVKQEWLTVVPWLLDHGADLHTVDDQGKNLMDAAMGRAGGRIEVPNESMVEYLQTLRSDW